MKLNWKIAALGVVAAAAVVLTGGAVIGAALGVVGTVVGVTAAVIGAATTIATLATLGGVGLFVAKAALSSSPSVSHAHTIENRPSNLAQRRTLGKKFKIPHDVGLPAMRRGAAPTMRNSSPSTPRGLGNGSH